MSRAELEKLGFVVDAHHAVVRKTAADGSPLRPRKARALKLIAPLDFAAVQATRVRDTLTLYLPGAPRTSKNSKTYMGVEGRPYRRYRRTLETLLAPHRGRLQLPLPARAYNCCALFYCDRPTADSVNLFQGLADLLERAFVVPNDWFIRSWNGSEVYWDKTNPHVELTLTPCASLIEWSPKRGVVK